MKLPLQREMRTLSNGLKVILIRKEGFSKSLFMMGIPAGSTNIDDLQDGKVVHHPKGCAHFLEHQMFRLNGEDVTYPLARVQAKTNACTSYEETCYYVWTNADPFQPLDLLIDFVQTLDITDDTVNKEKGIILSEYSQYEQDPESRLLKESFRSLYRNHPMRDDILGTPTDIGNMTAKDLQDFYQTWYDPAQLVLVGVTGHELEPLFDFIEKKEAGFPTLFESPAGRIMPEEPLQVCQSRKEIGMDVDLSYACLSVKLPVPSKDMRQIVRDDYMINMWLNGTFGSMNEHFQTWLDTHLIGGMSGAEADISDDHAYILIYSQSDDPKLYLETMKEELLARRPLPDEVFESLLIREKASSIRAADQHETLAFQSVEGYFKGYDPLQDVEILDTITNQDVTDYIHSLDLQNMSFVEIHPLEAQTEPEDAGK